MEVDSSSRSRQPTQGYWNNQKYGDQCMRTQQNLNHLPQEESSGDYESRSQHETTQVEDDLSGVESCNFLAEAPWLHGKLSDF
ncbi:GD17729 [Drosophila simulans]|uniref:GD17729 n=1 Tax=Drosophila simulans TaxID=7240 RepID=B4NSW7_DROSI|nr:GD17729 [Drosophila simulans]